MKTKAQFTNKTAWFHWENVLKNLTKDTKTYFKKKTVLCCGFSKLTSSWKEICQRQDC